MDSAVAAAEQARAEVRASEASEAIAQLNLRHSRATAPFDGAVAQRITNLGDYVKIGAPLFRVVDDTELKFLIQAPERYAGQIKEGQIVQFSVDAWPQQQFQGEVALINPAVSTTTRSFNIGALVPNPKGQLKANSFARGELLLEKNVPTPVIPLDAVVSFAGVTKVFIIENDTARARNVKIGRILGDLQEVIEGLREGESVATTGATKLYDGAKTRTLPVESTDLEKAQASGSGASNS
jgi:membrane fusion protein (multidrug efflux system)